jgi:hypothetical protein
MNDESVSQAGREREEARLAHPRVPRHRWPPGSYETTREGRRTISKVFCYVDPVPDSVWVIEHDRDKRRLRVSGRDGKVSIFRDKPV